MAEKKAKRPQRRLKKGSSSDTLVGTAGQRRKLMSDLRSVLADHGIGGQLAELVIKTPRAASLDSTLPQCGPGEVRVQVVKRIGGRDVITFECRRLA